jgi:lipopolysaccharide transport system ATP-binding protein
LIGRLLSFWRKHKTRRLVIVDDFFPNVLTAFRVAEYNALLQAFPALRVYSSLGEFSLFHAQYAALYPEHADRVRPYGPQSLTDADFVYLNFLNNAVQFLPDLEQHEIPFLVTLYPGGGLGLHESESDAKLLRVMSSPLLRGIITTQPITHSYVQALARQHGLHMPALHHIPGGVMHPLYFNVTSLPSRVYYGQNKPVCDIAFVAEKYMPLGANKGYPEFIAAALALADVPALRFHVVGSFTPADIDASLLGARIRWYGTLESAQLRQLLSTIDLIVSPNRPFTLHPGNFDGFPTGGCVEASLTGVAVMATDELSQNVSYRDGENIILIKPDSIEIANRIRALVAMPERLAHIAQSGQHLTRQLFAAEMQIGRRMAVLREVAHL